MSLIFPLLHFYYRCLMGRSGLFSWYCGKQNENMMPGLLFIMCHQFRNKQVYRVTSTGYRGILTSSATAWLQWPFYMKQFMRRLTGRKHSSSMDFICIVSSSIIEWHIEMAIFWFDRQGTVYFNLVWYFYLYELESVHRLTGNQQCCKEILDLITCNVR